MLMGTGLLSKFVEFVGNKLIGKRIDLALDEKRRACYSFVELLSVLKGFHAIIKAFITEIERYDLGTLTTINLIVIHRRSIQSLTTRFFDLDNDLLLTLEVVDPPLSLMFQQIHAFKFSVFYAIADSVDIPDEEPRNQSIAYRHPSDKILAVDMEVFYRILQNHLRSNADDMPWIWPDELTEVKSWEEAFPPIQFKTDDEEKLALFLEDLKCQSVLLETAIEKLRTLIAENFTLEEVLSSSRKVNR